MKNKTLKIILQILMWAAICAALIFIDQLTKNIVYRNIFYGSSKVLIPKLLEISHVHNTGAAWGMFGSHTEILSIITVLACGVLVFIMCQTKALSIKIPLIMVISGALGNLYDRITRGFVIDFIKVWIFKYEFPNFNFADSCITVGCVLLIIFILRNADKNGIFRENTLLWKWFEKREFEKREREKLEKEPENDE